ncbi:MAG TPA: TRAP transporter small permease [Desulfobacteraceae bacterium]|jgi:TRAP-type C4-dicarboxylate transport system permease small subunit|nr:TRAP transporter small permease [Desulfobacteraceae bacterium]HPJ66501.1 TRAP transporter small permease [Desulfobacteraceae bacterium]HPQ28211.1 TRAP transporter small permease [Desulfobacteraceae bacterium]
MSRISDCLNRVCEIGLILVLSAMAVAVFMQVLFRYILQLPLFWTEEFARYCLIWASLLGAAIALKRKQHIAVTFFLEHFPQRLAGVLTFAAHISVALILGVMTFGGFKLVLVTSSQISPALRIPMAVPYLALPVGSLVMLIHIISFILHRQTNTVENQESCL